MIAIKRGRKPDPNSPSAKAARWAKAHNASFKEAGDKFGVTAQAVQLAWSNRCPGCRWGRCGKRVS